MHALFSSKDSVAKYVEGYKNLTRKMVQEHSYKMKGAPGIRVDVVRNVVNLVAVHWVTDYLVRSVSSLDLPEMLLIHWRTVWC